MTSEDKLIVIVHVLLKIVRVKNYEKLERELFETCLALV